MVHITCDICGQHLPSAGEHFVCKIEVFAAHDPAEITEADLDADHMEEVSQLIADLEDDADDADAPALEPAARQFRYDLCSDCRTRYVRDPLARETVAKLHFSKN